MVDRRRALGVLAGVIAIALASALGSTAVVLAAGRAERIGASVERVWSVSGGSTKVRVLTVRGVPRGGSVAVSCHGDNCSMRRGKPPRLRRHATKPPRDPASDAAPDGTPPAPPGAPGTTPGSTAPGAGQSKALQALEVAKQYLGMPFYYGGSTPATGFDAPGLVQCAYAQVEVPLPRIASDQFTIGIAVARPDLRPGDLVFFRDTSASISHVGICVEGDQFIHAPHTGDVIKISSLAEPYYANQFAGGRRVAG